MGKVLLWFLVLARVRDTAAVVSVVFLSGCNLVICLILGKVILRHPRTNIRPPSEGLRVSAVLHYFLGSVAAIARETELDYER